MAEEEARQYAKAEGFRALDLFQAFSLTHEISPALQGAEVFSMLRESNLEPKAYLDTFYDTGREREWSVEGGHPPGEGARSGGN